MARPPDPNTPAARGNRAVSAAGGGFSNFDYKVQLVNWAQRAIPESDLRFVVKCKFRMQAPGADLAAARLGMLLRNEQDLIVLMHAVVTRTLVVNIRKRFLTTMNRAVEMHVLSARGDPTRGAKLRFDDAKLKQQLNGAFQSMNIAEIAGDYTRAAAHKKRIRDLGERLRERMMYAASRSANPSTKYTSHKLSTLTGNLFRKRMMELLYLMTASGFVATGKTVTGVAVYVGPIALMDQIHTPSATEALTGMPTPSRRKSFWRHLEFGTGLYKEEAKYRLNPGALAVKKTWFYSPTPNVGLLLAGTKPMNFITTSAGTLHVEDADALTEGLTKMLTQILLAK